MFGFDDMLKNSENRYLINIPIDDFKMIKILWATDLTKKMKWILNLEEEMRSQFKNYLINLFENKELRAQFGRKSLEIARGKFDYRVRNEKLSRIYQEILDN